MIGERIKQRRLELNMSQDELAKRMGYKSRSSINKIELTSRGVPQNKIKEFAKVLNTSIGYLMEDDEEDLNTIMISFSKTVGTKIKIARKSMNMTIEQLSDIVGIPSQSIEDLENGKETEFDRDMMVKFAHALNVETSFFLNSDIQYFDIGLNMKCLRELSCKTIEELSNYTKVDIDRIKDIENGKLPTFNEIEIFSNIYNIPAQWIINYDFHRVYKDNRVKLAFRIIGLTNKLSDDELDEINTYVDFIISKRKRG